MQGWQMGSPKVHHAFQSGNELSQELKAQGKHQGEAKKGQVSADCGDITH